MHVYSLRLSEEAFVPHAGEARLRLSRCRDLDPTEYRRLYSSVGSKLGWGGRLALEDHEIRKIIAGEDVHVLLVLRGDLVAGFVELEMGRPDHAVVRYLGLSEGYQGQNLGHELVTHTARYCFSSGKSEIRLTTRSTDHERALRTYRKVGFGIVGVQVEASATDRPYPLRGALRLDQDRSQMQLTNPYSYDIRFTRNLADKGLGALLEAIEGQMVLMVTTPTVDRLHGAELERALDAAGVRLRKLVIPIGEPTKSIEAVVDICNAALAFKLDRRGILLSVGGGVCMDATSFAASMVRRGIRHIRIPTTLIGQVDAGVGLKGGVNLGDAKSFLGCFYPPSSAFIDLDLLATLPTGHIRCGLSEIIKIAIARDEALFCTVEQLADELIASRFQHPRTAAEAICRSAVDNMLAELVLNPFERSGYERLVDFGHTFAHDLEAATQYRLPHGEAVAIDMALSTAYARHAGLCSDKTADRILGLLRKVGLPISHPRLTLELAIQALIAAERHRGGAMNWVVPVAIGACGFVRQRGELDHSALHDAFAELRASPSEALSALAAQR